MFSVPGRVYYREATSTGEDPSHPPCAAVDGTPLSFWLSTGLFPQTLMIRLVRPIVVYEVSQALWRGGEKSVIMASMLFLPQ